MRVFCGFLALARLGVVGCHQEDPAVARAGSGETKDGARVRLPGASVDFQGGQVESGGTRVGIQGNAGSGQARIDSSNAVAEVEGGDPPGVAASSPDGPTVRIGADVQVSAEELGIDFYPQASYLSGTRIQARLVWTLAANLEVVANLQTVANFYRERLPGARETKSRDGLRLKLSRGSEEREAILTVTGDKVGILLVYTARQ